MEMDLDGTFSALHRLGSFPGRESFETAKYHDLPLSPGESSECFREIPELADRRRFDRRREGLDRFVVRRRLASATSLLFTRDVEGDAVDEGAEASTTAPTSSTLEEA